MPISIFMTKELIGACHELIPKLNETHNLEAHLILCYMQKSYLMFFLEDYVAM
jgi:hypothetical protein